MELPATILIALGVVGVLALAVFEAVRVYTEGGLRLFFWPKLRHGYEVSPVARLAVVPWALLLAVLAGNGAVIALFGHDLLGDPATGYAPWLGAALVPMALVHLIDYRRSVLAAAAALLLLALGAAYALLTLRAWAWLPLLALGLLWSLNGVRALHADRTMS